MCEKVGLKSTVTPPAAGLCGEELQSLKMSAPTHCIVGVGSRVIVKLNAESFTPS